MAQSSTGDVSQKPVVIPVAGPGAANGDDDDDGEAAEDT